ncbi:MAG: hypothetical protein KIT79_14605 [Deltaproteobacteria bacterium]|nr:hypothetical protein [Deltaproteobacteria bacterium]
MEKVLFINPYGPFNLAWGRDMMDLLQSRLARGHGIFNMTSHMHTFALYLLAENVDNPSTVLEHPHWDEFIDEIRKGYDYIAIQLKSVHTPKVVKMIKAIRKEAPKSKIVVGGYGVSSLFVKMPGDKDQDGEFIRENADFLCREEGIKFMRRLLKNDPIVKKVNQYHMPTCGFALAGFPNAHLRLPAFLVSLGCPAGCDFCNTSAFFHQKKIYIAEPAQIYDFMKHYQKKLNSENLNVILFDEDMFLNPEYVRELGRLIRSDRKTWGIRWFSFGSVRALSHYEPEELRECGVGAIWVGVESSLCEQNKDEMNLAKREGAKKPPEVIDGLQRNGIEVIASSILGFDFHTRDNIEQDIDYFVNLKPTFYQIGPLTPCPGTKLFERMMAENRVLDHYNYTDFHLWKDNVYQLAHFEAGEMKKYFDIAHEKLRTRNGPPLIQIFESNLRAYENLKNQKSDFLRHQAELSRQRAQSLTPFMKSVAHHAPSPEVHKRVRDLLAAAEKSFGPEPLAARGIKKIVEAVYDWRMDRVEAQGEEVRESDPPPRWTYYNEGPVKKPVVRRGRDARPTSRPYARDFGGLSLGAVRVDFPRPAEIARRVGLRP